MGWGITSNVKVFSEGKIYLSSVIGLSVSNLTTAGEDACVCFHLIF